MTDNPHRDILSDEAWQAGEAWANRPAREIFDDLIRAGIINEQGEVLVRMPTFGPDEDDAIDEVPAAGEPAN